MEKISVPVYTPKGEKAGSQELNPAIFGDASKMPVIHQVTTAQQANSRQVLAHTKTRAEVRGGGRKPWKQKGTGRARHGSIRSPLWVGGGITFGPRSNRNFTQKVNRKVRKQALLMVLSDKVANDRLIVVTEWGFADAKTKHLAGVLMVLPGFNKKTLVITTPQDRQVISAAKNLAKVTSIGVNSLNVLDVLRNDYVVVPKGLVNVIETRYKL